MAKVYLIYVGVVTALALCKYSLAEWNVTEAIANRTVSHCHHHSNKDNCTEDSVDTDPWLGHFSKCPKELTGYCVHGECRYIEDQKAPSCRCDSGYNGARCEYINLPLWWKGGRHEIIIICVIAGLVLLILLILFICLSSNRLCRPCWRRRRRRQAPTNGTEKLGMMDTSGTQPALSPDPAEPRLSV